MCSVVWFVLCVRCGVLRGVLFIGVAVCLWCFCLFVGVVWWFLFFFGFFFVVLRLFCCFSAFAGLLVVFWWAFCGLSVGVLLAFGKLLVGV